MALGTFALGVAEFGMMGFLADVAAGVDVDISKAGTLISGYSTGVAIGAPCLLLLRKLPLKRIMMLLASMIVFGSLIAAFAPNYTILLIGRFISGLPHGAFFGAGAIVCTRLATPGHGAVAISLMVAGMTVANVIGVPLATFLSDLISWRLAFAVVSAFGLLSLIGIALWMPQLSPLPDSGLKGQFRFLRKVEPWLIYGGVFFGQMGVYCWLSYVDPIMTEIVGVPASAMTWVMMLIGMGMVCGNLFAGKMADRHNPAGVSGWLSALVVLVMPLMYMLCHEVAPTLTLSFIAAGCLFGLGGPAQFLIVKYSEGGEMLGGAGIQIAFNVSNAVSAALGSAVIGSSFGLTGPILAGVPFAIIGALCFFGMAKRLG